MPRPLTPAQQRFVDAYLCEPNAVKAYRVAHPRATYGTAAVQGHRLLRNPKVAAEIRAARIAQQRRTQITADKVLKEIGRVAFSDIADLFDDDGQYRNLRDVPLETRRVVSSFTMSREQVTRQVTRKGKTTTTVTIQESVIHVTLCSKVAALAKLVRHLGLQASIPPLESLMLALPPALAAEVRSALASPPDRCDTNPAR